MSGSNGGNRAVSETPMPFSQGYTWYVLFLLTMVAVFNTMDRIALSVLAPGIKVDLHLSDGQVGLLVGLAFSLVYAVCGIPIARLADRGNRRNVVAVSLAVWSVMTALTGAATHFWHLLMARIGVAVGESGALSPSASIICDYAPLEKRAGFFAIHGLGSAMGATAGIMLAGWLGGVIGWQWTFVALGVPGIAFALLVRLTLREPVRGMFDARPPEPDPGFAEAGRTLLRCVTYKRIVICNVIIGLVFSSLQGWWPSFFMRSHMLSSASTGLYYGLAQGVGGPLGILLGGLVANRIIKYDVRLPLRIAAAGMFLSVFTIVATLMVASPLVAAVWLGLSIMLTSVILAPMLAAVYSVVSANMRATAGAISNFFSIALGLSLGAFLMGWLSDMLAPDLGVESLRYAMLAPVPLLAVAALVLWAAAQSLPRDIANVE